MNIAQFYGSIDSLLQKEIPQEVSYRNQIKFLLSHFRQLTADISGNVEVTILNAALRTKICILFEGFYQFLSDESVLKHAVSLLRGQLWTRHFNTPTLLFSITYHEAIQKSREQFFSLEHAVNDEQQLDLPWNQVDSNLKKEDVDNQIIVNPESFLSIPVPEREERTGEFTKTHNPIGGFTTTPCDPISQAFIEAAENIGEKGGVVLEVGAGFGAGSLAAVAKGATVFCNDITPQNLAVIRNRYAVLNQEEQNSLTGDTKKLIFIPGKVPEDLTALPDNYFDAILICRVLHFFSGKQIEKTLKEMVKLLKPEGRLYIVCETPYLKNWSSFIPEYEKRVAEKIEWPGEIQEPCKFETSGRASTLPQYVNWFSKELIEREYQKAGLVVERIEYINRKGQFPDDLLIAEKGQESVGGIGIKPR